MPGAVAVLQADQQLGGPRERGPVRAQPRRVAAGLEPRPREREECRRVAVGRVLDVAAGNGNASLAAARRWDGAASRWFLDPVFGRPYPPDVVAVYGDLLAGIDLSSVETLPAVDFLGVNYYSRFVVRHDDATQGPLRAAPVGRPAPRTAMGWEIHPPSLRDLLLRLHREYAPSSIVITENGAAFDDRPDASGFVQDDERIAYLAAHVAAVDEARAAGVPVDGYLLWSLLDNFEWAEGYAKRFGIVRVDYVTLARVPKASARWYPDLIRQRGRL